jgi:cytochrome P450
MIGEVDVWSLSSYDEGIPQDLFTALRHEAPVYRHADPLVPEGHWAITRHADVQFVSRNPEIFSSHEKTCLLDEMPDEQVAQQQMMMINLDPPDHSRLRSLVNRGFTPRMIGKLREQLEKTCEGILDRALEKAAAGDSVEAVTEIASDLPLVVIADMMGVPQEDRHKLFEWSNRMVGSEDPDLGGGSDGAMEATMEVYAYAHNLGADRSLAKTAADEIVRWVTPVMDFRRTAMKDVELGGVTIKAGDKVIIYYTSANRDESVFADPFTFDIGRDPNPHLGFGGGGPHFCLGRHLALLEIEIMFESLARRVESLEFASPPQRMRSHFLNGLKDLKINLQPA